MCAHLTVPLWLTRASQLPASYSTARETWHHLYARSLWDLGPARPHITPAAMATWLTGWQRRFGVVAPGNQRTLWAFDSQPGHHQPPTHVGTHWITGSLANWLNLHTSYTLHMHTYT